MSIDANGNHLIFMKVGHHAGEGFDEILARKRQEYQSAGGIWWGFGGSTLHPITRVQPFAKYTISQGDELIIVMQPVVSSHVNQELFATEYSEDGVTWRALPKGVKVTGSRYAVILDEIVPVEATVDLSMYRVANGPSAGRLASEYVKGRVDKAPLERGDWREGRHEAKRVEVKYAARVKRPFGVLVR